MVTSRTIRILSLLLALVAALTLASCAGKNTTDAPASEAPPSDEASASGNEESKAIRFALEDVQAKAGETVTVRLKASENPGIAGFSLTVGYDEGVLEFVSGQQLLKDGFGTCNAQVAGKVRVMSTRSGITPIQEDGDFFEVTFRVKDGAPAGKSELTLTIADEADTVYNFTGITPYPEVPSVLQGGSVTVS